MVYVVFMISQELAFISNDYTSAFLLISIKYQFFYSLLWVFLILLCLFDFLKMMVVYSLIVAWCCPLLTDILQALWHTDNKCKKPSYGLQTKQIKNIEYTGNFRQRSVLSIQLSVYGCLNKASLDLIYFVWFLRRLITQAVFVVISMKLNLTWSTSVEVFDHTFL